VVVVHALQELCEFGQVFQFRHFILRGWFVG